MWTRLLVRKRRAALAEPIGYSTSSSESQGWRKEIRALNALAFPDWSGRDRLPPARRGSLWVIARTERREILVGYAFVYWLEGVGEEVDSVLEQVAVHPAWQGRGIGRRLVFEVASATQRLGRRRLSATPLVGVDEKRRESWLRSLGFNSPWGRSLAASPREVIDAVQRLDTGGTG